MGPQSMRCELDVEVEGSGQAPERSREHHTLWTQHVSGDRGTSLGSNSGKPWPAISGIMHIPQMQDSHISPYHARRDGYLNGDQPCWVCSERLALWDLQCGTHSAVAYGHRGPANDLDEGHSLHPCPHAPNMCPLIRRFLDASSMVLVFPMLFMAVPKEV